MLLCQTLPMGEEFDIDSIASIINLNQSCVQAVHVNQTCMSKTLNIKTQLTNYYLLKYNIIK